MNSNQFCLSLEKAPFLFSVVSRSEVFAAMLRHEFLEKQNSRVDVKEIDGETMELLLSYIYTGQVYNLPILISVWSGNLLFISYRFSYQYGRENYF